MREDVDWEEGREGEGEVGKAVAAGVEHGERYRVGEEKLSGGERGGLGWTRYHGSWAGFSTVVTIGVWRLVGEKSEVRIEGRV